MSAFATCDICDAHRADPSGGLCVLPPVWREFGASASFSGQVSTVQCFEDNSLVRAALESPGDWLCADADGIVVLDRSWAG